MAVMAPAVAVIPPVVAVSPVAAVTAPAKLGELVKAGSEPVAPMSV